MKYTSILTTLVFGHGVKPLTEQLQDAGLNMQMFDDRVRKHIDGCQAAIELLWVNKLIDREQKEKISHALVMKISDHAARICGAEKDAANN